MSATSDFTYEFVAGSSARTLLLLHGTGGNEHDLLALGRELDATASLLSPRGRVLENGMPRFFRRLAEGVFDEEDLQLRAHELADFVLAAAEQHQLDAKQIVAVGYSNGANIAAGLMLLRPEILHAAVLLRPMVPLVPDAPPDLSGVPVYIAAGNQDPIVPVENTQRLVKQLRDAGAQVTATVADAGHALTQDEIAAAKTWLGEIAL
jgi:predicted esterase